MTRSNDKDKVTRLPGPAGDPVAELLRDPILDPALRLRDAVDQLERCREDWQEAKEKCDDIADPEKLAMARAEVRHAYGRYEALQAQASKLEAEVRRRTLEVPRTGEWQEQYDTLLHDLKDKYDGFGPHYDLLCEQLSSVAIRIRMMELSGRDVASGELVELHKLMIGCVNQLQRYTEAMKTESVNKMTQEVALQLMQLADRHFGNTYPIEFKAFVADVRTAIEQGAAA